MPSENSLIIISDNMPSEDSQPPGSALSIQEYNNNDRYTIPDIEDVMTEEDAAKATVEGLASLYAYWTDHPEPADHPFSLPDDARRRQEDLDYPISHATQHLGTDYVTLNGVNSIVTGLAVHTASRGQEPPRPMQDLDGDSEGSNHSDRVVRLLISHPVDSEEPGHTILSFDTFHELPPEVPTTGTTLAAQSSARGTVIRVPSRFVAGLEERLNFDEVPLSMSEAAKIVDVGPMLSSHMEGIGSVDNAPQWPPPIWTEYE